MSFRIGSVEIGGANPCRFVAELGNAHNGSLERAFRLIDAAKAAGADLVKFQCYQPDELVALRGDGPAPEPWGAQGWTMRTLYEKAQTPHAWFRDLVAHCQSIGMPWFSSVFGADSLALLESLGNPCYKIARLDGTQVSLFRLIEATRKPYLLSVGPDYMPPRVDGRIPAVSGEQKLFCPPGYPAEPIPLPLFWNWNYCASYGASEDVHYLGLSSHCLDPEYQKVAVARGAKLIEMHFQLDDEPSELEANVSLSASAFAQMVRDVRKVEAMLA